LPPKPDLDEGEGGFGDDAAGKFGLAPSSVYEDDGHFHDFQAIPNRQRRAQEKKAVTFHPQAMEGEALQRFSVIEAKTAGAIFDGQI
jgi:hypothetical protein